MGIFIFEVVLCFMIVGVKYKIGYLGKGFEK